jgi:Insect pheromone-binding family, A10/OS-D
MKTFLLICAALLALTPSLSAQGEEKYSRRYDNIDVNTIFRSSRLLHHYVDCLLDKKPCPPEGKDLKRKSSYLPASCLIKSSQLGLSQCHLGPNHRDSLMRA